jgi:hypothetical protein
MKNLLIVGALCALAVPALAQTAPPDAAVDKTTHLTYNKIVALQKALGDLDGYQKVITEGGKERAIAQPYDFSEATRFAIADDEIALQDISSKVQAEAKAFSKSLGDAASKPDTPEAKQWAQFANDIGDKSFAVFLLKLNRTELKLGANAIPPSVLTALDPVIEKK